MKKIVIIVSLMLFGSIAMAQDTFKQDAIKYMELSGQMKAFEYLTNELSLNVPEASRPAFKEDLNKSLVGLKEEFAKMYMTEFTPADLKEMIKFYESPVGKKLTSKYDVIYEKSQVIGQEWGAQLQAIMMKYLNN